MSEVKQIFIPWWVLLIIGAVIVVLFLKFCPSKKDQINNEIAAITAAVQATHIADSIKYTKRQKELIDSSLFMRQQIRIVDSLLSESSMRIDNYIAENKRLINKYKNQTGWVIPPIDTGSSLVPAEFINDCKDCFTQLEKTNDAVDKYRYEYDQMQVLYMTQMQIDSTHLTECENERLKVNKDYNNLRMAVEVNAKSLAPRRKLKIGIGGRFDNQFLPNGVGPGIMYQDKKDRNFAFTPLYGNGQPAYVVEVFVPIFSF